MSDSMGSGPKGSAPPGAPPGVSPSPPPGARPDVAPGDSADDSVRAPRRGHTGVVLSGGGARGAYEAGVMTGLIEALGLTAADPSPFRVFAGTSVGAINAAFLAAHAHRGDLAVAQLEQLWMSLEMTDHMRLSPLALLGWPRRLPWLKLRHQPLDAAHLGPRFGRSMLDPRPLEALVQSHIPWARLHANVADGLVEALIVAALHIGTGRTTLFAELSPGASFRPSKDPRRNLSLKPISADHILASAAIPLLFPARRVGSTYYCDGGLRFSTPISSAIRAGADRLVVVSLMHNTATEHHGPMPGDMLEQYPSLSFLAGKLLNALLLDPIMYDLQTLDRFNALSRILDRGLDPAAHDHIDDLMIATRGAPYRRIETLIFRPSCDVGTLAGEFLRAHLKSRDAGRLLTWLLGHAAASDTSWEADLASYLLFDRVFARTLFDLGRADALRRGDEVRAFFADAHDPAPPAP